MEPLLDRGLFRQVVHCLGVRVRSKDVSRAQSSLGKNALLNLKRLRSVQKDGDDYRVILLDPSQAELTNEKVQEKLKDIPFELRQEQVELSYDHFDADEVLRKLLPADVEVPSGFETVGHIAHLNLRPEHEPFKHRIGQVIVDKAANIKTVVNKVGIIETQFRTFPMEVLAGENSTQVDLRVNGLRFKFDFAKVYWNTRLSDEHERLVSQRFSPGDLVIDAFCGVGPFAVRAAKKQCRVMANDLNPESVNALVDNVILNKLKLERIYPSTPGSSAQTVSLFDLDKGPPAYTLPARGVVQTFNADAREFMRFALDKWRAEEASTPSVAGKAHVVMNLPATAIEFLDALRRSIDPSVDERTYPFVHCYCFSSMPTLIARQEDVRRRVLVSLGLPPETTDLKDMEVREVRDVAPNKFMMCAHFQLPVSAGRRTPDDSDNGNKRVRHEDESTPSGVD